MSLGMYKYLCILCLLATSVHGNPWDGRQEGDYIFMLQENVGIPKGERLPIYQITTTSSGAGRIIVYYDGNKKSLYEWHENQFWVFESPIFSTINVERGLGFTAGILLVTLFSLAFSSRTV